MVRDISVYKSIGSNEYITTHGNLSYNHSICSNPYTITYNWTAFSFTSIFFSNENTLMDITVFPNYCSGIDGNIKRMIYGKPLAYLAC